MVRESVLGQSAFDPGDAYSPPDKTHRLARAALDILARGRQALAAGATFSELEIGAARRALAALRDTPPAAFAVRAEELAVRIAALWTPPAVKGVTP
jgi:vacuolar-type H+-ATPase catalytic subunit A/Vma1